MKKTSLFSTLLIGTFLSTSAVAQTVPTIDANYLNGLTGEKVTWQEVTASGEDTVQIGDKYYKYTYHKPNGYTETSIRINDTLATSDVTDVVFENISSTSSGGAIYNTQNNSSVNIKADFIGNTSSYDGGAIYNGGTIGNITGDFIANYGLVGAIANWGTIGDITGDFIDNYSTSSSYDNFGANGAILNFKTIGNIIGNFVSVFI